MNQSPPSLGPHPSLFCSGLKRGGVSLVQLTFLSCLGGGGSFNQQTQKVNTNENDKLSSTLWCGRSGSPHR